MPQELKYKCISVKLEEDIMAKLDKKADKLEAKERKAEKKKAKHEWKRERSSFWTDFKKFITKGNVLDMAVAVVVATAFNAIVTGLVKQVITPAITYFTSGISIDEWKYVLKPEVLDEAGKVVTAEIAISYGLWIQSIIDFIIIAFSVFVFVRIFNNMYLKMNSKEAAKKAAAEEKKKEDERIAKEKAEALAAREEEFYANVKEQSELLKDIKALLEKNEK